MATDQSYLPKEDAVVQTIKVPAAAPGRGIVAEAGAPAFQILRTMEIDPTDAEKRSLPEEHAAVAAAAAVQGDNFAGSDRKAAKLSIAQATVEPFADIAALLKSLPPDEKMAALNIPIASTSNRVKEEKRNVTVKAWLYAASREKDNDFHTILGTDPSKTPRRFMNAEVSGLPPASSASRSKLKAARDAFVKLVQGNTPHAGYDFYKPPIPVTIDGSLFFDATHSHGGATPGPAKTKPNSIWEIHPVTSLTTRKP